MNTLRAIALVALVACKKHPAPPDPATVLAPDAEPPPSKCATNADCVVMDIPRCCAGCPGTAVRAVAKGTKPYVRDCHDFACSGLGAPGCAETPVPSDYEAVCKDGVCKAELRFDPSSLACASDAECAVTDRGGACECCAGQPRPISAKALARREAGKKYCLPCQPKCPPEAFEPTSAFVAKCASGQCIATHRDGG